jgi:hypothetical protein
LCIRHNIQIKIILRRGRSHFGKTKKMKLFFKELEEERKKKFI